VELAEPGEWRLQVALHQVLVEMLLFPFTRQAAVEEPALMVAVVAPVLDRPLLMPLMETARLITFSLWPKRAVVERVAELAVMKTVGRPVTATVQTEQTLRVR
jgi:hypothetical protein